MFIYINGHVSLTSFTSSIVSRYRYQCVSLNSKLPEGSNNHCQHDCLTIYKGLISTFSSTFQRSVWYCENNQSKPIQLNIVVNRSTCGPGDWLDTIISCILLCLFPCIHTYSERIPVVVNIALQTSVL